MAMPVMVSVEMKVTQTGTIPDSWHTHCTLGPSQRLYMISTKVTGLTKVQRSRSLMARFTIRMLLTWDQCFDVENIFAEKCRF
jgi:hypothetical protein